MNSDKYIIEQLVIKNEELPIYYKEKITRDNLYQW
jgi:hypothetical protein